MFNHRRLHPRARRQRRWMDENLIPDYPCPEGGNLFREGRRRRPRIRQVLVAVPRARDAAVYDLAFAKRPILVLADIGDGRYAAIVLEYRDSLTTARDNTRPLLPNAVDIADR